MRHAAQVTVLDSRQLERARALSVICLTSNAIDEIFSGGKCSTLSVVRCSSAIGGCRQAAGCWNTCSRDVGAAESRRHWIKIVISSCFEASLLGLVF